MGNVPGGKPEKEEEEEEEATSLEDICADVVGLASPRIRQPQSGETHVRIPEGSVPGSEIKVLG